MRPAKPMHRSPLLLPTLLRRDLSPEVPQLYTLNPLTPPPRPRYLYRCRPPALLLQSLLFPAPGTKPDTSAQVSYSDRGLGDTDTGRRDAYVGTLGGSDDAPMSTGDISVFGGGGGCGGGGSGGGGGGGGGSYGFHDRYDSYGVYFSDMSSASAPTPRLSVAEKPGKFWDLYGSAEEGEGSPGNVVLALDVLGSFDFYSIPAVDGGGAHEPGTRGGGPWSGGAAEREVRVCEGVLVGGGFDSYGCCVFICVNS